MKKNKFMRLASVMLMLCLITTCAISGTFAKYTTSASAMDSARVAKWGVTVEMMAGETIFKEEYVGTDSNVTVDGEKVDTSAEIDVVAPGTNGTLSTITIDGAPEVTVDVTTEITLDLGNKWTTTGSDVYCPIVFTVGTETYGLNGMKIADGLTTVTNQYATVEALEIAVINAILTTIYGSSGWTEATTNTADITVRYAPHHDFNVASETFSWVWAFEGNDDEKDTILGNLTADATDANDPTINFSMSVLVEQVD